MTQRQIQTSNKRVQTIIHCYPHILLSANQVVTVYSDRGCQTAVSTTPQTTDITLYTLLEFTPYQVIAQDCIKEIDLPKKALLKWNLPNSAAEVRLVSSSFTDTVKGLHKHKGVLKKSLSSLTNASFNRVHHIVTMQRSVVSQEVQTTVTVLPHVLDTDEVANVFTEHAIQTSITCLPSDSISQILPKLKANLSHASGYTETPSALMNAPPEIEPSEDQPATEEIIENIEEPSEEPTENSPEELPEDTPEEVAEEPPEEIPEDSPDEITEDSPEQAPEEEPTEEAGDEAPEQLPEEQAQMESVSVTVSTAEVKSQRCSCRTKFMNKVASQLRVKTSTLKLTPVAFPPNVPFADRMVEVLNTIVAVLQTEMANLMEIYVDEEKQACGCTDKSTAISSSDDIRNDPRSCKCKSIEAATNTDNNQMEKVNDPRSCKCGAASSMPKTASTTIAQGSQKEIKKTCATRQVMNPTTNEPDFIKENVVEETIRTVTLSNNRETIIEEKSVTTTIREKISTSQAAMKPPEKKCKCSNKSAVEVIKPAGPMETETEESAELISDTHDLSEAPETLPLPDDELGPSEETAPLPEDESVVEPEPAPAEIEDEPVEEAAPAPAEIEDEPAEETEPPAEAVPLPEDEPLADTELQPAAADEIPEEGIPAEVVPEPQAEVVGDGAQTRRLSFIPCECHPTEAGAAVPILACPGPSAEAQPPLDSNCNRNTCNEENPQPTSTEIALTDACSCDDLSTTTNANATSNLDELTDEAPSLTDDTPAAENTLKFKILLKKGMKQVESASATSAIVVRANISCPDTRKDGKPKIETRNSLPDLREQVIRLRVIYKSGQPETQIEELLSPSSAVAIAPNKSHSSRVSQTTSKISTKISIKTESFNAGGLNESKRLVGATGPSELPRVPSKKVSYSNPPAPKTDPCDCTAPRGFQPSYHKPIIHLPIEVEEVPSSAMACPVHPKKPTSCVPACGAGSTPSYHKPTATPSSQKPPPRADKMPAIEVTIAITSGDEDADNIQSPSFMYEHDANYEEPYMDELVESEDATTACQTDLTLGDKLQSESLNSLGEAEYKEATKVCASKTEMPWHKISLPPPGSYSIQPVMDPTQQVAVMTDANATESETQQTEDGVVEEQPEEIVGEVTPEGDEEGSAVGEEEPPGEPESSKRKDTLLFESEVYKDNEPYMESLYRAYPDSDEGECGSQTEIPWKDIILPENCRIKKVPKQKKCTCMPAQGKLSDNERVLKVVNPSMYGAANVTETKSCTQTSTARMHTQPKSTSSMPQIPSQKSVKATVSFKRLGQPDQVISQTMNAGENQMTFKVPDTPISVNLQMSQMSSPGINSGAPKQSSCPGPCSTTTANQEPKEIFVPARCPCKDKVKLDTFRQNPVMAALEAYEAEMKPLRLALVELQQKIRNLDMPEMKGCLCTTVLQSPPLPKICEPCPTCPKAPGVSFGTTSGARPNQNPPGMCPYFRAASFQPPPLPPYGRLPPPVIPPRFDAHLANPPNYTPPNVGGQRHQNNCPCTGRDGSRNNVHKKYRSNRDSGKMYPRQDLAMEARCYGMYPDYRGRTYSNERVAYEDSFIQDSRTRRGGSPDRYKTKCVVSIQSSGNVTSDYGGYDSQAASDGEDSYHRSSNNTCYTKDNCGRRGGNKSKFKSRSSSNHGGSTPGSDCCDSNFRDGQAVKTSPDEFLSCPGKASKTKLKIKFPRY